MGRTFRFVISLSFNLAETAIKVVLRSLPVILSLLLLTLTTFVVALFAWWRGVPATVRTIAEHWMRAMEMNWRGSEIILYRILELCAFIFIAFSFWVQSVLITLLTLHLLERILN